MISPVVASFGTVIVAAVAAAIVSSLRSPLARSARLARVGDFVGAGEVAHDAGLYDSAVEYFLSAGNPERAARSALRGRLVARAARLYEQAGDLKRAAYFYAQAGMKTEASAVAERSEAAATERRATADAAPSGVRIVSAAPERGGDSTTQSQASSVACADALSRAANHEAMPPSTATILRAVDDPRSSPNLICQEIGRDLGLLTMVLRAANSSFYGARGQVLDVTQALVLIGYDSLRQLIVARFSRLTLGRNDVMKEALWKHSLATAIAAQACARAVKGITVGHAFTCGLLHDIGQAVLAAAFPAEYLELWAKIAVDPRDSAEIERERFETDHTEVGAALLRTWDLPPLYSRVIRSHHGNLADARGLPDKERRLCAIVGLASAVAEWVGYGRYAARPIEELTEHPMLTELGATPALAQAMAAAIEKELAEYAGIFG